MTHPQTGGPSQGYGPPKPRTDLPDGAERETSPAQGSGIALLELVSPPWPDPQGYLKAMVIPIVNRAGQVVSSTIVDPELYPSLSRWRWSLDDGGYAFRMRAVGGRQEKLKMHRVIMCCTPRDGLEIDHVNRAKLDNRRANLRFVTRIENMQNRDSRLVKKQRVPRKVARPSWDKHTGKWVARFDHKKVTYSVGRFTTYEEAEEQLARARERVIGG